MPATAPPAPPAQPLLTAEPWHVAGVSRAGWYRIMGADLAPKPIKLPGCRRCWRVSDVVKWAESLQPAQRD